MAWPVGGISIAVTNFDWGFHQMIKILEGIFQPIDFREGCRHMNANFKESIAEVDRDAHFCSQPADAHDIGHLSVDIEKIRAVVFQ